MPRFVVLEHEWPRPHLDFLLEADGVLRAWRLLVEEIVSTTVPAEPNFDHRLLYLEFEGPLSGDRGTVRRWDVGTFDWIENGPERVAVELRGGRLIGRAEWTRSDGHWIFPPTRV